jgi:hypothetical protein
VVNTRSYIPQCGDVVWISLTPQAGHEQAGRLPAVVLSPQSYNVKTGLAIFCPVTSQIKNYPFEVLIPAGLPVAGAIFKPDSSPQVISFPKSETHLNEAQATQMEPKLWKIILPWSHEALAQAAFEMTFWYMGQIGKQIYSNKTKPQYLAYMTLEEIGLNRVKEMLRNAPLRPITEHQAKRAEWLYNAYCFGYPIGADNKEMIFLPGEIKQAD